jgi:hemolysin III
MNWLHFRDPVSAWTHFAWMVLALPGMVLLLWLSRKQPHKQLSMLVFGLSLILCYGCSFLFHAVPLAMSGPFNELDHIGIYFLIAGTVTPIAVVGLRGAWRAGLLILIWVLAAAGITVRLFADPPLELRTAFYLVMGWVGLVTYFQLVRRLSHRKVSLVWIGGLIYSIGAVINAVGRPSFASWFDAHDLFHVFVMAGSLAHYTFMLVVLTLHRDARIPLPALPAPQPATSLLAAKS